jgi:hypothetical protein
VIQRGQIRPQGVNRVTLTVGRPLPSTPINGHSCGSLACVKGASNGCQKLGQNLRSPTDHRR